MAVQSLQKSRFHNVVPLRLIAHPLLCLPLTKRSGLDAFSLDPTYRRGRIEILFVCLSVRHQHFRSMAFKSSQNHVRPHILYTIGSGACLVVSGGIRSMSGGVWWCLMHVWWCPVVSMYIGRYDLN